ncbi:MAG TPA: family 1 glycosylhydrolase [Candidatus Dormibacteraeota bacterium]|nr:family 1 glycosylhydrolase [Candidatus Dormibacteraeota bacterium]
MREHGLRRLMLVGVCTADHQCEAHEPACEDVRDRWERDMRLTPRGRATQFWTRYPEDVALARGLGCTAFRFSVSWARVEPAPGEFSAEALDGYRAIVDAIADAGMEPVLTLLHYTWPLHLADRGGLLAEDFPDAFARYTAEVVRAVGARVRYWVTLNEPNQLVYGYIKPWWAGEYRMPPGLPPEAGPREQLAHVVPLMRSLFVANARARATIKAARPDAIVTANPFLLGLPGWLQRLLDWRASRLRSEGAWAAAARPAARRPLPDGGRVDLVAAALTATPERGAQVDFSRPYHVAGLRLLVPAGSTVRGRDDVAGATVAAVRGSTAAAAAGRLLPGATVLRLDGYVAALAALDEGTAAALLMDDAIGGELVAHASGRYALVGDRLRDERHVVATATGNRGLLQVVDDVIEGRPTSEPPDTPGVRRIARRGRLVAGLPADAPASERELAIAREVARRVLGDPSRLEVRALRTEDRLAAVRPWTRFLDPLLRSVDTLVCALNSNWWHLGMAGRLPDWLCPADCVGQQDIVGMDYYWGVSGLSLHRAQQLAAAAMGTFDRAPVWPGAMRSLLRYLARGFPGQPIMVIENGCVQEASGVSRAGYLRRHWAEVRRAVADGVPVTGYLVWSITSNREWGLPFGPSSDFGVYHVDLDRDGALTRLPTDAVEVVRAIAREAGGLP